jgi:protein-S-isoprenylcysteine O-methyltransferase Ste14
MPLPKRLRRLTKPRFLFVYPVIIGLLFTGRVSEHSLRAGLLLLGLGEALRLWANGFVGHVKVNQAGQGSTAAKIGRLITAGPYAFVRHPLYLGTLLLGAGFCVMVQSLWVSVAALAGFLMTYHHKMAQEEALLLQEYAAEYARYREAVPRLWPGWRRYPHGVGRWSWRGVFVSKEWKTVIWVACLAILAYFWEEYAQEGEGLFKERVAYRVFLLVVLVVLMATDGVLEFVLRRKKRKDSAA